MLGTLAAAAVYVWAKRRGRNEVFAGGAADAAFGDLPPPKPDGSPGVAVATRLVSDDKLDEMATIEFVPPKGLQAWEGAVLLDEKLNDSTVQAWLSGLAGREAIEIDDSTAKVAIGSGRRRNELDATDAALLDNLIGRDGPYQTGEYDPQFAAAWRNVAEMQKQRIAESGWWKHMSPGRPLKGAGKASLGLILFAVVLRDLRQGGRVGVLRLRVVAVGAAARVAVPGVHRLHRLRRAAARSQRPGFGAGVADRVVQTVPARQRGAARRVGVEARPAPRVQRMGGRARRGRRVG